MMVTECCNRLAIDGTEFCDHRAIDQPEADAIVWAGRCSRCKEMAILVEEEL